MLAHSEPELIANALSERPRTRTRYSILSPRIFAEELAEIRRVGFAIDREETQLGIKCIGAPILRSEQPIGAISVTGVLYDIEPSLVLQVRRTAQAIAKTMQ
jgi:DNA-binding IclR family transcriptional regulator